MPSAGFDNCIPRSRGVFSHSSAPALSLSSGSVMTSSVQPRPMPGLLSRFRPIRCQTWATPKRLRGRDGPSCSFCSSPSKRAAKRSVMPAFGLFPGVRVAVETQFHSVFVHDALEADLPPGPGLDRRRDVVIEPGDAFAADHEKSVAVVAQPGCVVLSGQAARQCVAPRVQSPPGS